MKLKKPLHDIIYQVSEFKGYNLNTVQELKYIIIFVFGNLANGMNLILYNF